MNVNEISDEIYNLDYEDKKKLYSKNFSSGYLSSGNLNDKLILISLISLSVSRLKLNNPNMTTLDFLVKLTETKNKGTFYKFLESFSIIVDDLAYEATIFDNCGLTSSKDIINKIKETLKAWLPF